ncbi:cobalamin B12-binding domain-containing protein [Streptacidiphilus jiangxiensis]|uniref:Methylaspartate mutase sigma subunit/methylaspartate mutase epsilon subunit n=1 Tax=Streptacidiphilus jiangxiensis TaxID=235985 RepID=A0A1H7VM01_STRJI|nr:cobalamin-dependent protein [Streptacidiphilus jiangxiensis]SEM09808.1 methylaspartate mutase sigma subunit/methylaspartate mutase epsilon subunit [Streptacidiphilus jiangxiensis]
MRQPFRSLLVTVESDSHMWNLVYLQKVLEENGGQVRNLGACTPVAEVLRAVGEEPPDLLVVSSVNGHGLHGARVLLQALREQGLEVPCVVGGKLTTAESNNGAVRAELLLLGYTEVFTGDDAIARFQDFLRFGKSEGFSAWQADAAVVAPWDAPTRSIVEVY